LLEQDAAIDIFGVGTRLVTGHPDAALDGVYKLSAASGKPRLKLSETPEKTTLPGIKQVHRIIDRNGMFFGADIIMLNEEKNAEIMFHPFQPEKYFSIENLYKEALLKEVMHEGKIVTPSPALKDIASFTDKRLSLLPAEYKRFENPHLCKVGISKTLLQLRNELSEHYKKNKQ